MAHETDKAMTRRASVALIGGLMLLPLAGTVQAADQLSAQDMVKKLMPSAQDDLIDEIMRREVRGKGATDQEQEIIEDLLRRESRSLSDEDRGTIVKFTKRRRSLDLEINFDYDSAVINPKAMPLADELGQALVDPKLTGNVFLIGGHTDGRGSDDYNNDLSRRRAEAVKTFLMRKFSIPAAHLKAVGFGKEFLKYPDNPLADENRRVQIVNMFKTN